MSWVVRIDLRIKTGDALVICELLSHRHRTMVRRHPIPLTIGKHAAEPERESWPACVLCKPNLNTSQKSSNTHHIHALYEQSFKGRRRPVISAASRLTHLIGQRRISGLLELVLVLRDERWVDLHLWRSKGGSGNKLEGLVTEVSSE